MTYNDVIVTIFLFALLEMVVEVCAKSRVDRIYQSVKFNSLKNNVYKTYGEN